MDRVGYWRVELSGQLPLDHSVGVGEYTVESVRGEVWVVMVEVVNESSFESVILERVPEFGFKCEQGVGVLGGEVGLLVGNVSVAFDGEVVDAVG